MRNKLPEPSCSRGERQSGTRMETSSRQLLSRRVKVRPIQGVFNPIGGGLVCIRVPECVLFGFLTMGGRKSSGNTRVISQTAIDHFSMSLSTKKDDPYSVLLRRNKLPMALLDDAATPNVHKVSSRYGVLISFAHSDHTSWKLSHLVRHLVLKPSERNQGLTSEHSRNSAKLVQQRLNGLKNLRMGC